MLKELEKFAKDNGSQYYEAEALLEQSLVFKKKGDNLWNFRCPYCGDSKKSRTKARGFVFRKKNDLFFKCHNCGMGTTLGNLIKYLDSKIYKDYIMERYSSGVKTVDPKPEFHFNAPVFRKKGVLKNLKSISNGTILCRIHHIHAYFLLFSTQRATPQYQTPLS